MFLSEIKENLIMRDNPPLNRDTSAAPLYLLEKYLKLKDFCSFHNSLFNLIS